MPTLAIDHFGILERFGRPYPDGIGLAGSLLRLREGFPSGLDRGELTVLRAVFDAVEGEVDAWGPAADLPLVARPGADAFEGMDLFVTASAHRLRLAEAAGTRSFGVTEAVRGAGVPMGDVPRRVAEALRLPTPRPMAPGSRSGTLLVVEGIREPEGRVMALEAIAADPHADWIQLDDRLAIYTEDPDLEDRLASSSGARRLASDVRLATLVVVDGDVTEDIEPLLRAPSGITLSRAPLASAAEARSSRPWHQVRRRSVGASSEAPSGEIDLPPGARDLLLSAQERYSGLIDAAGPVAAADGLRLVTEVVGPAGTPDVHETDGAASALSWTSPYRGADAGALVVISAGVSGGSIAAWRLGDALSVYEVVRRSPSSAGVLFWVPLSRAGQHPGAWASALLPDERGSVARVTPLPTGVLDDPTFLTGAVER